MAATAQGRHARHLERSSCGRAEGQRRTLARHPKDVLHLAAHCLARTHVFRALGAGEVVLLKSVALGFGQLIEQIAFSCHRRDRIIVAHLAGSPAWAMNAVRNRVLARCTSTRR